MSSNIFSVLNTAKVGLLSQQLAIEVTGNNIANVQTKGYSRQEVNLEAQRPRTTAQGQLGTGVRVAGIERSHDQFLFLQILSEGGLTGDSRVRKDIFDQLEVIFNEDQGRSLSKTLSAFFASLQDISTNPSGLAERADLLNNAQDLASVFNQIGDQLFQIQRNIDLTIDDELNEINSLTTEIAKLNTTIHANEPGEFNANDLRDKRDRLIKELSEKIDIQYVNESDGQVSLTLSNGTPIVLKNSSFDLSSAANGNNKSFKDVFIADDVGALTNITSTITEGELKGLLDMRDVEVDSIKEKLDILAAGFIREFNNIHQSGFGLDGSTGVNFFNPPSTTVFTNINNTGSAQVTATNGNPSTISADQYEIVFTGSNTFTLNNLTTGFTSGTVTFTAGSTFNLANGFAVTITGSAAVGDRFELSVSENAARNMSVATAVLQDSRKIAAGNGASGDGGNALDLANLQSSLVFDGVTLTDFGSGAFTFDDFYNSIVSGVGVEAFTATALVEQQDGVMLQLDTRRESASGVSIDEEMINLIKFQQAFNAAARIITSVQEMFQTLDTI